MVFFCESSLLGLASEAIVRGFDPATTMSGIMFSCPGTDVIDVGSDLMNSEIMNSILNTADVLDSGIVSEENLRRVYDAYASIAARMFCERWMEPGAKLCGMLYTWHIENDRHWVFRRALLGYRMVRKERVEQKEADFDEAFGENLRTTGFSRPLKNSCNGGDPCDAVGRVVKGNKLENVLAELWSCLVTTPMEYILKGEVSQEREDEINV
ncbi:uncharacterized protein BP5553_10311 [Venustampulla echinocandica]|uniref:Uncharacterized protein n=1 Tax=Venustampulla echinocandica TaxID=2656787 RepID=A0A370T9W6_9HELO|nr:uncharacterized protein BP5553_10311 [Venustampulla echinocandica]RDL30433.1 hypothetical protein BP5553_10311 [Venustampulla echinocandica]